MPVVAGIGVGDGVAEVDFTVSGSTVTGITIRSTIQGIRAVKVFIQHVGSGYLLDTELVLGAAPITISLPNPRRFPNDNTATVRLSTDVRTVP